MTQDKIKAAMEERLLSKIEKDSDTGCWNWQGSTNGRRGYGKLSVNGKLMLAHRWAYTIYKGEIPDGLTIDHLCRNRLCVNPKHLEVVTQYENNMRGDTVTAINKRKTHCSNGHEFTKENIWYRKRKDGMRRDCKKCRLERRTRHSPATALINEFKEDE